MYTQQTGEAKYKYKVINTALQLSQIWGKYIETKFYRKECASKYIFGKV